MAPTKKKTTVKERTRPKNIQKKNVKVYSAAEMAAFRNLRLLREEHGLTQKEWASEIGWGHSYVRSVESGRFVPSYGAMILVADYCNVSIDWILGRTNVRVINKKTAPSNSEKLKAISAKN